MREAHAAAFDETAAADLPLADLVSRVVDPLVAFNVATPGATVLLGAATPPAAITAESGPLHQAVAGRVATLIGVRAPEAPESVVRRAATVAVQIVAALMAPIVAAGEDERPALVAELKRALVGYLGQHEIG